MKKLAAFLTLIVLVYSSHGQDKKMCVTVDDLPLVHYGMDDPVFQERITEGLLKTFDGYDIPAIGYVNEGKLYKDDKPDQTGIHLLELWLKSGYELGNHTYSHMNYHKSTFEDFTADILRGEAITRNLTLKYGSELKFFRHPYLKSGQTKSRSDSLKWFLKLKGYAEAPVTIDNDDYLFAKAYHIAHQKKDSSLMVRIGRNYVDYMEKKLIYFEKGSDELFGRNISQTLLIHANLLNSHYLDDLAEMYLRHGYRFVSQAEVLEDEAYNEEITRFGDWGISWLERWALSKAKGKAFFEGDTETPDYIKVLAK